MRLYATRSDATDSDTLRRDVGCRAGCRAMIRLEVRKTSNRIILGPAPCSVCKHPLIWNGKEWLEDGRAHRCSERRVA